MARKAGTRSGFVSLLRILQRDQEVCHICLRLISNLGSDLHFDHVIPISRGGQHEESNVKLAHASCNTWKGIALMSELELLGLSQLRETGCLPETRYSRIEYLQECIAKVRISG